MENGAEKREVKQEGKMQEMRGDGTMAEEERIKAMRGDKKEEERMRIKQKREVKRRDEGRKDVKVKCGDGRKRE